MLLHMPTFHIVLASVATVAFATLCVEWGRTRRRGIAVWALAFLLFAAMEISGFVLTDRSMWRTAAMPGLRLVAFALLVHGSLLFADRKPSPLPFLLPAAWALLWLTRWNTMPSGDGAVERQLFSSCAFAALCVATAFIFLRHRPRTFSNTCVALVFGVHAAVIAGRILVVGSITLAPGMTPAGVLPTAFLIEAIVFVSLSAHVLVGAAKDEVAGRWRTAAEVDSLTGVLSRPAFLRLLSQRLENRPDGVLALIDLDHFKSINDEFGHAVGDEALRVFARTVSGAVGRKGAVGRLGGEEFAVLLDGTLPDASQRIASALRIFTEAAATLLSLPRPLTASAGIAPLEAADDVESLLLAADRTLYSAKAAGRNRVETAREARDRAAARAMPA